METFGLIGRKLEALGQIPTTSKTVLFLGYGIPPPLCYRELLSSLFATTKLKAPGRLAEFKIFYYLLMDIQLLPFSSLHIWR